MAELPADNVRRNFHVIARGVGRGVRLFYSGNSEKRLPVFTGKRAVIYRSESHRDTGMVQFRYRNSAGGDTAGDKRRDRQCRRNFRR